MNTIQRIAMVLAFCGLCRVGLAQDIIVRVDALDQIRVPKAGFDPSQYQGAVKARDAEGNVVIFDASEPPGEDESGTEYVFPRWTGDEAAAAEVPPAPGAPAAEAAPAELEIDIAEAAGTLTDPTDFIYISQEFVFNLLVLASTLNIPGVQFDVEELPTIEVPSERAGMRTSRGGDEGLETRWAGESTAGGRRTVSGARYLAGLEEGGEAAPPVTIDHSEWLDAVSVSGNEQLGKLLEFAKELPEWQRVARIPLLTTEKQKVDEAIADVYSRAFNWAVVTPQAQTSYGYYGYYDEEEGYARRRPGAPGIPPAPGAMPGGCDARSDARRHAWAAISGHATG
ncbi:hypothetical protein AMJ85_11475 [candidate division BRC1 bacterium SM23_51]|nr:MAG: hypothetical protein AMJ85_11475 [candidate division BRC1 bacterium SM23_51]